MHELFVHFTGCQIFITNGKSCIFTQRAVRASEIYPGALENNPLPRERNNHKFKIRQLCAVTAKISEAYRLSGKDHKSYRSFYQCTFVHSHRIYTINCFVQK